MARQGLVFALLLLAACPLHHVGDDAVAQPRRALSPRYPDVLRSADVEGDVVVDIPIDSAGRVDASHLRVIKSTHDLFLMSVRRAIDTASWLPARQMGHPIPSVRRDTVSFVLTKDSADTCPKSNDHHQRICTWHVTVTKRYVS